MVGAILSVNLDCGQYNGYMARGWESKSVEEQISEKQEQSRKSGKTKLTREQQKQSEQRAGLMLARANTLTSLDAARDQRYRALLERRLAHLDTQLAELDKR